MAAHTCEAGIACAQGFACVPSRVCDAGFRRQARNRFRKPRRDVRQRMCGTSRMKGTFCGDIDAEKKTSGLLHSNQPDSIMSRACGSSKQEAKREPRENRGLYPQL